MKNFRGKAAMVESFVNSSARQDGDASEYLARNRHAASDPQNTLLTFDGRRQAEELRASFGGSSSCRQSVLVALRLAVELQKDDAFFASRPGSFDRGRLRG